jgi:subtilase family serine protease
VGIQGAGPEVADLAPILTIASEGATCDHDMLVQIGVINRGTGPAYNFTVEWSLGWSAEGPEVKSLFVPELQWGTIPLYIVNGMVRVPCQQTSVYTAFIHIDINNDVTELFEDNNNAEETYTILFFPPGG